MRIRRPERRTPQHTLSLQFKPVPAVAVIIAVCLSSNAISIIHAPAAGLNFVRPLFGAREPALPNSAPLQQAASWRPLHSFNVPMFNDHHNYLFMHPPQV